MSKHSLSSVADDRDGSSLRSRAPAALDPDSVRIDGRSTADLVAFVQAFAARVRFLEADPSSGGTTETGNWGAFASSSDLSVADIVAYISDPTAFDGERARWLGRPHFVLMLAFLELLGHAREQLNGLTKRHLDHFYREVLRMRPRPAAPDRVAVLLELAGTAERTRIAAGTDLAAGRDDTGVPRTYRTERDVVVTRAVVGGLRSVYVDRRRTRLADVRNDRELPPTRRLDRMLELALGVPRPGDRVPTWRGRTIDSEFLAGLGPALAFARNPDHAAPQLHLEHHELRTLMGLLRRRRDADAEWAEINRCLGVVDPADPRDFMANLESRVGVLDFAAGDGLPQVSNIDDLYAHADDDDAAAFIRDRLAVVGLENFKTMMQIKLRIDDEWAEINRLIEGAGARQRGWLTWALPRGSDGKIKSPTDFAGNFRLALGTAYPAPTQWPEDTDEIDAYEARIRELEVHLSMPVERLAALVGFARGSTSDVPEPSIGWLDVEALLADAHTERLRAVRRAKLADIRGADEGQVGAVAVAQFVLGSDGPITWADALVALTPHLEQGQLSVLDLFYTGLAVAARPRVFDWPDAYRLFELAWRRVQSPVEPPPEVIRWHNLYAFADARSVLVDPGVSTRWRTFGARPPASNAAGPSGAAIGWAVRSPALALAEGIRRLTITLGFDAAGFDHAEVLRALGVGEAPSATALVDAVAATFVVEASSANGWLPLPITSAHVAAGAEGDDYWSIRDRPRSTDEVRPALQIEVLAAATHPALEAILAEGDTWPTLRVLLRQHWDANANANAGEWAHRRWVEPGGDATAGEWTRPFEVLAGLELAAVALDVHVDGLVGLALQHEDRRLDPRKPFEPFGSRPAVGARLYLDHPELCRVPPTSVWFAVEWMGLPERGLAQNYVHYRDAPASEDFRVRIVHVERGAEVELANVALFDGAKTKRELTVDDPGPAGGWPRRLDPVLEDDLRARSRYLLWDLTPQDFGHGRFASLAAEMALKFALTDRTETTTAEDFRVDPPYTPTIRRLALGYERSIELIPGREATDDALLHVHPFGVSRIPDTAPTFFPPYEHAGELYIGLLDAAAPEHVTLLVQLAEGTSDPDASSGRVAWSCLREAGWRSLEGRDVLLDTTRSLSSSGIVELALPVGIGDQRLPRGHEWIRVATTGDPRMACDGVDVHAQAVMAVFADDGNAASHYARPLPAGSIDRLVEPDPAIAKVAQPYSSHGARAAEDDRALYTRTAERLRHKARALTTWDYERLVLAEFPQIHRAKCLLAATTRAMLGPALTPGRVDVVVVPDIRDAEPRDIFAPRASASLLAEIREYLTARAPAVAQISVRNARFVAVKIRIGVRFRRGIDEGFAQARLNDALTRFLSPWAFDDAAELTIGGRIYANSIVDFLDRREEVDYVANIELFRGDERGGVVLVPPVARDYFVSAGGADGVLVSAPEHIFDVIPDTGYEQSSFTGINYARIELDFIVG